MIQTFGFVFDETIHATSGSKAYFTSSTLSMVLASADQLALQAIADDVKYQGSKPPELSVHIETSGNAVHWATKNKKPEIDALPLPAGITTASPYAGDSGALPSLRYVRLRITLKAHGASASAHLKIVVALRDAAGQIIAPLPWKKPDIPRPVEDIDRHNVHIDRS